MLFRYLFACLACALLAAMSSCGGGTGSQDLQGDFNSPKDVSHVFTTELIAGAGQGWPDTGTDVGNVTVWNDATNLYVQYDTEGGWYFGDEGSDNLHLYVGESGPPGVAPGQFPFTFEVAGQGTSHTFTLPLVGNYPAGGYMDGAAYDWTGDNLYVAAHGVTCIEEGEGGGGGEAPVQGVFTTMGIWMGNTNIDIGDATFAIDGTDLVITVNINAGYGITDLHLYLDPTTPPAMPFGGWDYVLSGLLMLDSYEFRVPLADIPAWCDDHVYVGLHVHVEPDGSIEGLTGGSGTTWEADCAEALLQSNGRPHQFFKYCDFFVPPCEEVGEGEEICETAWGLDDDGDEESGNEDGWFENFFGDPNMKWGWVFEYQVHAD